MDTPGGAAMLPWQRGLRDWVYPRGPWRLRQHRGDSLMTRLRRHQGGRISDVTSLEPKVTPWWSG